MFLAEERFSLNVDCVEVCSLSDTTQLCAVGCYELDTSTQKRQGEVHVLQIAPLNENSFGFEELAVETRPGILDVSWNPDTGGRERPLLVAAAADGVAYLHEVTETALLTLTVLPVSPHLLLSVDWTFPSRLLFSDAGGRVACVVPTDSGLVVSTAWCAHGHEVWCTVADRHDENTLYSGSDDCALKGWDLRVGNPRPVLLFEDRFAHRAGVCSIASDPHCDTTLCTGSYDGFLRLWDKRSATHPKDQVSCGGGVWRVKYNPARHDCLAAACMHDGFKLLSSKDSKWSILHAYQAHQGLAYGIDWLPLGRRTLVTSCSFEDKLLHFWDATALLPDTTS